MKLSTEHIQHYPPHLGHVAALPWKIKNSNFLQIWKKIQRNCDTFGVWNSEFCTILTAMKGGDFFQKQCICLWQEAPLTLRGQSGCCRNIKWEPQIFGGFPSPRPRPLCNKNHYTATGNHMPYGITQCYLPPSSGDFLAFTPAEAGTRFSNPGGMQGWVDLGGGFIPR